jgi:hypothetical protein
MQLISASEIMLFKADYSGQAWRRGNTAFIVFRAPVREGRVRRAEINHGNC